MVKKYFIIFVLAIIIMGVIFAQNRNPLAYTSWEPRPRPDPFAMGVAKCTIIDFDKDTFLASDLWGSIYGKYTVSGNTVTFMSVTHGIEIGILFGGRLIIGRATFYRL